MNEPPFDSPREMVFVWEAIAYDRYGRTISSGGGATAYEAKLDLVRDVPASAVKRIHRVSCERVLVSWRPIVLRASRKHARLATQGKLV